MMTQLPHTDYDLLAEVATPDGVTAGPWRTDMHGHLIRTLSDGRTQRGDGDITTQCKFCTVPLNDPARTSQHETDGVCTFCREYTAPETPAQRLDVLVNRVDLIRHDGNDILQSLPAAAPLMAVVDVVTALGHLRRAAVALDRATDALESDAQAVQR